MSTDEIEALRARLAAVEALHQHKGHGYYSDECRTCRGVRWPCPTALAAAGPTEEPR